MHSIRFFVFPCRALRKLALAVLLVIVIPAPKAHAAEAAFQLERCAALWTATLTVGGEPAYSGTHCEGKNAPMTLGRIGENPQWPVAISTPVVHHKMQPVALVFRDADAPEAALWQGEIAADASEPITLEPSKDLPPGMFSWQRAVPLEEHFYVEAIDQDLLVLVRALRARSTRKDPLLPQLEGVLAKAKSPQRVTLRFSAIETTTMIALIAQVGAVAQNHRADGALVAELKRDQDKLEALQQQFYAANQDDALELKLLAAMRALNKMKSRSDLPPDARFELDLLAGRLEQSDDYRELKLLREEMLAYAQRLDARPDSAIVALARAELAYVQQRLEPHGTDDLTLLQTSVPILLKDTNEVLSDQSAARIAKALLHRKDLVPAVKVLEKGLRAVDLSEYGAIYTAADAVALLLSTYRQQQRIEPARALLDRWRKAAGLDMTLQAFRVSELNDLRDAGRFSSAVPVAEEIVMLAPQFAAMSASDLDELLASTLRTYFGAGDYGRAARVHALYNQFMAARVANSGPSLAARRNDLLLLQTLAALSEQTPSSSFWNDRLDGKEPMGSAKSAVDGAGDDFGLAFRVMIELARLLAKWQAFGTVDAALPAGVAPTDAINAAEVHALLIYYHARDSLSLKDAQRQFQQAQHWRRALDNNPDALSARETWFAAAIKAIAKLPPPS